MIRAVAIRSFRNRLATSASVVQERHRSGLGVGLFFLFATCWDGLFEMGKDPINLGIDIACSGFKNCDAVIHLGIEVTLFIDLVADEFKMRIN
jgi:hypothetical protein